MTLRSSTRSAYTLANPSPRALTSDAARSCLRQRVASRVDADGLEPPASADLGLLLGLRFLPPKQFDTRDRQRSSVCRYRMPRTPSDL